MNERFTLSEFELVCDLVIDQCELSPVKQQQTRELILNLLTTRGLQGASKRELNTLVNLPADYKSNVMLMCGLFEMNIDIVEDQVKFVQRDSLREDQQARNQGKPVEPIPAANGSSQST